MTDTRRREALAKLAVLDTARDPDFDRLTRLAAGVFSAEVSLVSLVDVERQWFLSCHGVDDLSETPIGMSFCAHTISGSGRTYLLIPDATADDRFAENPLVTGDRHVRFYVGAPITVHGERIGSLCVLDPQPKHDVTAAQIEQLIDLADLAGTLFELKDESRVRARMAAALMQEEWRHALTLEAGKVGSWVWDVRTGEVIANDIFKRMYLLEPGAKVTSRAILEAVRSCDRGTLTKALRDAVKGGQDYAGEYRIEATGRWLMARGRVFQRDAEGRPLVIMGINLDVTETKQAAEGNRLLLRELNHRVKNTLAMIQSLARQTLRRTPDPEAFMTAFSGRLQTLTDAHRLLADRDWAGIGLLELIDLQVAGMAPDRRQLIISGPDMQLPPDHALGLGIILHELATNAVKFGAFSVPEGRVVLSWRVTRGIGRRVLLTWREENGPKVVQPGSYGLGGKLIERSLAKVLDSEVTLSFPPDGVSAEIAFPLEA